MTALVVFESMFGHARTIARSVAAGIGTRMAVEVLEVSDAPSVVDADLVVVGGPNHRFGLTTAASRREAAQLAPAGLVSTGIGLHEWLAEVAPARPSVLATAFDTRLERPRFLNRVDRSAQIVEKRLRARGFRTVSTPRLFYVLTETGPLRPNERARALDWGRDLAAIVTAVRDAGAAAEGNLRESDNAW